MSHNPNSNPAYAYFSPWEEHLAQIISRFPEPSIVTVLGRSPSTVRQNLQQALRLLCENPYFSSVIPHDRALLVSQSFVFSPNPDGSIYIGPRRSRPPRGKAFVGSESAPPQVSVPPIDCSNPQTLSALCHLKNFDHLPIPIEVRNLTLPDNFSELYPNIEIMTNPDGNLTLL